MRYLDPIKKKKKARDFRPNAIILVASCSKAVPQRLNFKLSALQVKALHFSFYKNNSAWKAYSTR